MSRPNWHPGVCTVLGAWAWAGMRPLSEKSPASTDRRLHGREGEGAEEYSQEEPGRSVPGISFQAQHEESSSQWDESMESMDLGGGGIVPQNGWVHWPMWGGEGAKTTKEEGPLGTGWSASTCV